MTDDTGKRREGSNDNLEAAACVVLKVRAAVAVAEEVDIAG